METVQPLVEKARELVAAEDAAAGFRASAAGGDRPKAIRGGGAAGASQKAPVEDSPSPPG